MKKTVLPLVIFFIFILSSSGISQIQIGPAGGVNLGGMSLTPDAAGRTTNFKPGFSAGAVIIYNFSSMFSLQVEPAYVQKGALIKTAMTDVGFILELKETAEINYMDVPLSLRVSFEGETVKPFLFAGMNISFPVEDLKVTIDNLIVNGEDFTHLIPADQIEQKIETKKIDYGLNFGAGISFPVAITDLFFSIQYNLGLSDLNKEQVDQNEENIKLKNKGFQVKTGILFTF